MQSFIFLVISLTPAHSLGHFGTKTSYFGSENLDDSEIVLEGCQPAVFWLLARHGARYPGVETTGEIYTRMDGLKVRMKTAWREGQGTMEEQDKKDITDWKLTIGIEDAGLLARSGDLESFELGQRWKKRLANLTFESNEIKARASRRPRAHDSAKAFLMGLFNETSEDIDIPEVETDDHILKFYEKCPKYLVEVKHSDKTETDKFEASEPFLTMVDRVRQKTGVVDLTNEETIVLYAMCRYELAWYPDTKSSWCSVFSEQDLEVFHFLDDLIMYYTRGPAFNVTSEMTQPLWSDLMDTLDDADTTNYPIRINFGHKTTLLPFLTSLGLYNEYNGLQSSDWPKPNRIWNTSHLSPFAANLAVLLFDCEPNLAKRDNLREGKTSTEEYLDSEEDILFERVFTSGKDKRFKSSQEERPSKKERYSEEEKSSGEENSSEDVSSNSTRWKVMVFHNERPVTIPSCGASVCSLDTFQNTYKWRVGIDLNSTCSLSDR